MNAGARGTQVEVRGPLQGDCLVASSHSVKRICVGSPCCPGHSTPWRVCICKVDRSGGVVAWRGQHGDEAVNWNPMS